MSKYAPLGEYLKAQPKNELTMAFSEIERITETKLPPLAQHNRAWWSNNPSNNVMTKVWLDAGFKTERVDIEGRKLVFRRVTVGPRRGSQSDDLGTAVFTRDPLFGALKGTVLVDEGVDLTEPADPDWGKEE